MLIRLSGIHIIWTFLMVLIALPHIILGALSYASGQQFPAANNWMPLLGHTSSNGGIRQNSVKVSTNVKNAVVIGNTANVDTHIGTQHNAAPSPGNNLQQMADSLQNMHNVAKQTFSGSQITNVGRLQPSGNHGNRFPPRQAMRNHNSRVHRQMLASQFRQNNAHNIGRSQRIGAPITQRRNTKNPSQGSLTLHHRIKLSNIPGLHLPSNRKRSQGQATYPISVTINNNIVKAEPSKKSGTRSNFNAQTPQSNRNNQHVQRHGNSNSPPALASLPHSAPIPQGNKGSSSSTRYLLSLISKRTNNAQSSSPTSNWLNQIQSFMKFANQSEQGNMPTQMPKSHPSANSPHINMVDKIMQMVASKRIADASAKVPFTQPLASEMHRASVQRKTVDLHKQFPKMRSATTINVKAPASPAEIVPPQGAVETFRHSVHIVQETNMGPPEVVPRQMLTQGNNVRPIKTNVGRKRSRNKPKSNSRNRKSTSKRRNQRPFSNNMQHVKPASPKNPLHKPKFSTQIASNKGTMNHIQQKPSPKQNNPPTIITIDTGTAPVSLVIDNTKAHNQPQHVHLVASNAPKSPQGTNMKTKHGKPLQNANRQSSLTNSLKPIGSNAIKRRKQPIDRSKQHPISRPSRNRINRKQMNTAHSPIKNTPTNSLNQHNQQPRPKIPFTSEHVALTPGQTHGQLPSQSGHVPSPPGHVPLTHKHAPLTPQQAQLTPAQAFPSSGHVPLTPPHVPSSPGHVPLTPPQLPLSPEQVPLTRKQVNLAPPQAQLMPRKVSATSGHVQLQQTHIPLTQRQVPRASSQPSNGRRIHQNPRTQTTNPIQKSPVRSINTPTNQLNMQSNKPQMSPNLRTSKTLRSHSPKLSSNIQSLASGQPQATRNTGTHHNQEQIKSVHPRQKVAHQPRKVASHQTVISPTVQHTRQRIHSNPNTVTANNANTRRRTQGLPQSASPQNANSNAGPTKQIKISSNGQTILHLQHNVEIKASRQAPNTITHNLQTINHGAPGSRPTVSEIVISNNQGVQSIKPQTQQQERLQQTSHKQIVVDQSNPALIQPNVARSQFMQTVQRHNPNQRQPNIHPDHNIPRMPSSNINQRINSNISPDRVNQGNAPTAHPQHAHGSPKVSLQRQHEMQATGQNQNFHNNPSTIVEQQPLSFVGMPTARPSIASSQNLGQQQQHIIPSKSNNFEPPSSSNSMNVQTSSTGNGNQNQRLQFGGPVSEVGTTVAVDPSQLQKQPRSSLHLWQERKHNKKEMAPLHHEQQNITTTTEVPLSNPNNPNSRWVEPEIVFPYHDTWSVNHIKPLETSTAMPFHVAPPRVVFAKSGGFGHNNSHNLFADLQARQNNGQGNENFHPPVQYSFEPNMYDVNGTEQFDNPFKQFIRPLDTSANIPLNVKKMSVNYDHLNTGNINTNKQLLRTVRSTKNTFRDRLKKFQFDKDIIDQTYDRKTNILLEIKDLFKPRDTFKDILHKRLKSLLSRTIQNDNGLIKNMQMNQLHVSTLPRSL